MKLVVRTIKGICSAGISGSPKMNVEVDMTTGQMFDAILTFAEHIPSETFFSFLNDLKNDTDAA